MGLYIYIHIYLGKFHHELTVLPHWESWLIRGIINHWFFRGLAYFQTNPYVTINGEQVGKIMHYPPVN